jgi:hypothetical protein
MAETSSFNPPLPVGKKVLLSEEELTRRKTQGWTVSLPPAMTPEEIKAAAAAKPVPFSSLPPEKQKELKDSMPALSPELEAYVKQLVSGDPIPTPPPAEPVASSVVAAPEVKKQEPPHLCPNCMWPQDIDMEPAKITDQDKENFLTDAVLGGKPFTKAIPLFGGRVTVVFRRRSQAAGAIIQEQLTREIKDGRIMTIDTAAASHSYMERLRVLNLAASLVSITGRQDVPLPELDSPESIQNYVATEKDNTASVRHQEIFKGWPGPLYAAVYKAELIFEQIMMRLVEAANSESFWARTAG